MHQDHRRSSRHRYRAFVQQYKRGQLDEEAEKSKEQKYLDDSSQAGEDAPPSGSSRLLRGKRREYLREYLHWLRPHGRTVAAVLVFALLAAGLEMVQPLFMRFIVDRVLLKSGLDAGSRLVRLHFAGGAFLLAILLSNLIGALKDYRQRLLNARVMLSLRRSLFQRLLHLPLPKLWDMKTGGILSRLTGDVDTTTGLLQMAIVSPAVSVIRLVIAVAVLLALNWRLALTALAIIPGVVLMSITFARRVRPIYRSLRKDAEQIDGRVGETFSGIRVVRAFRREIREVLDYMRGRILLNSSNIRDFRLGTYRDLLAIVQQDVFLFDGSVRDNIAYGRHDAADAEIEDAARRANAHEFIVKLPEQYETFIGERGVKLSGGQQQRLAIARAILASPQILILDEATSNLDSESEQLIQASMADLLAGRTTFVIAHRLSTIRRANLILLMDNGRVIERGTHQQLMSARGEYYQMVLRQMEFPSRDPYEEADKWAGHESPLRASSL